MQLSQLDLNLLWALEALLEAGSVSGAGERLGRTTSAMSHALSRLRGRLSDPLLVRAGRRMALTPRAEELKPRVRALIAEAKAALSPAGALRPGALSRVFRLSATDHLLAVLGAALDRAAAAEAPGAALQFVPNTVYDAARLRDGELDLAIGVYDDLPPEMRAQKLFEERFVCAVRASHPLARRRLTLERYVALGHIQVSPRGRPGGYVDDQLAALGLKRRVARVVPYFLAALLLASRSDLLLTISERVARELAPRFGLALLPPPLPLAPYDLTQIWHPRSHDDPAHRWLRALVARSARALAPLG